MPSRPTTNWPTVLIAVGAGVVAALQVGKVPPAIGLVRAELGAGLVAAGWVLSLFNLISATGGVAAGFAADRVGARRLILTGLAALALGSLSGGLAGTAELLLLARTLEGLGFLAITVAVPSIVVGATGPAEQRLALGIWSSYMPAGVALMMFAAPALLAALGWRGVWFANALLAAAYLALFAWQTRRLAPIRTAARSWAALGRTLARPGPWLLALSFSFYTIQWFGLASWLPTLLTEEMGYSLAAAAFWTAAVVAANVVGNLVSGVLLTRGAVRWVVLLAVTVVMGLTGAGVFLEGVPAPLKLVLGFVFSGFGGLLPGTLLAGVPLHSASADSIGATNGFIVQGANMGTLLGAPIIATLVAAAGTWQATAWVMLAAGAGGAATAWLIGRVERRLARPATRVA
jgi:MFS family permease